MLSLKKIMSSEVVTVGPDMTLREVAELFASEHITGAPVVDGARLLGVVSTTDLLDFEAFDAGGRRAETEEVDWDEWAPVDAATETTPTAFYFTELWSSVGPDTLEQFRQSDDGASSGMDERTVSDVMTRSVFALSPHDDVRHAAEYMVKHGIHRVLVIDDGEVVGIVSTTDVMRAVAERGLAS